jgi:serine phosphatase RsbU (regulator of sigma subunit)
MNQPKRVKYQYKLEGMDENWSGLTSRNEATYGNLPHGTYTFIVKAMNSEGVWSKPFEYTFTIRPPWWRTWWAYGIYFITIIGSVWYYIKWREKSLKERQVELEEKVDEATLVIRNQKEEVEKQKHIIEEKHKEITDSITYAERIQRALLASKKLLDQNLKDYFILFKPKDVVSGDFYWATKLSNQQFVLVTADSTGHGVPGAIMSIVNIASLKEAVIQGITSPDMLLNETRRLVIQNLKNDGSAEGGKDGMDATLISFDFENNMLTCACANNPIWIIRNNELLEIKGERMPIGKHEKEDIPFTMSTIPLQKDDVVYTLTDGFSDQFGGPNGKKFKYKPLQELLLSIANLPMPVQKQKLALAFDNWKGDLEQVDDVCIVGVRV